MTIKNGYIVMWDCQGLESVVPVPELDPEQAKMWEILGGPKQEDISGTLFAMKMRAQVNSQRFYEIYAITASEGIERKDIIDMFAMEPQCAADTIRRIGVQIFSNRANPGRVKIT
jgi:hypothetical protein